MKARGRIAPRVIWTVSDMWTFGFGPDLRPAGDVASFLDWDAAVTFARARNQGIGSHAPRFQVERSLVIEGRTV